MANYNNLRAKANEVKNEQVKGRNTANRVGTLFNDIIDALSDVDNKSVSPSSINNFDESVTQILGDSVTVNPSLNSGTQIATIKIGNKPNVYLYAPTAEEGTITNIIAAAGVHINEVGTPTVTASTSNNVTTLTFNYLKGATGETGATGPQGPQGPQGSSGGGYNPDDPDLIEQLEELDDKIHAATDLAKNEKDRLDQIIDSLDNTIKTNLKNALKDAQWIQQNFPEGVVQWNAGWNTELEAYLSRVGLWKTDENTTKTFWSDIQQSWNGIKTTVTAITEGTDFTEMLQSAINQGIQDGTVTIDLSTTYASKNAEDVIEWMYSALKNQSSSDMTLNELHSAGKSGLNSAISEVRTVVNKVKNGNVWDYIAESDIESKVNDAITGLYNSASSSSASTTIFSTVKKNSSDIATIATLATGNETSADIATKFANFRSGLVLKTAMDEATANLIASNGKLSAAILAKVNENGSTLKLSAKQIDLTNADTTFFSTISGNTAFITNAFIDNLYADTYYVNKLKAAVIETDVINSISGQLSINADQINFSTGTYIIDADHINLTGEALAGYFSTDTTLTSLTNTGLEFRQRGGIGQVGVTSIGYDGLTVAFTNPSWGGGNSACAITPAGVSISYSGQNISLGINSANGYLTVSNDIEVPGITIGQGGDAVDLVAWMDYVNGYINEGDFVMDSLIVRGTIKTGNYTGTANAQFTTNDGKLVLVQNGIIIGVTQQG